MSGSRSSRFSLTLIMLGHWWAHCIHYDGLLSLFMVDIFINLAVQLRILELLMLCQAVPYLRTNQSARLYSCTIFGLTGCCHVISIRPPTKAQRAVSHLNQRITASYLDTYIMLYRQAVIIYIYSISLRCCNRFWEDPP
jgi:hypothetical protein